MMEKAEQGERGALQARPKPKAPRDPEPVKLLCSVLPADTLHLKSTIFLRTEYRYQNNN